MGYSKNKLKKKIVLRSVLIVLLCLLVAGVSLLILANTKDVLTVQNISDDADNVSEDVAKNSAPIIVDNILIGAVYNNEFVSADKYVSYSSNKVDTEVNVYTSKGKSGTFKITDITKKDTYVLVTTSSTNVTEEYFALPVSDVSAMSIAPVEAEVTDEDYDAVKKALGKYRLLNNSINIDSVYDVSINLSTSYKIICVTSSDNEKGVYSAVIFSNINSTKSKIIKYSYVKDKTNAQDWPIYSFEFAADLNQDGNSEIIIRELTEFNLKYSVLEYQNDNFVEVLSADLKIQE